MNSSATRDTRLPPIDPSDRDDPAASIEQIADMIARRQLYAVFQPIVDFRMRGPIGYEGLIRGPADTPLHLPAALFASVRAHDLYCEFEAACRAIVISGFVRRKLPGTLFINASPECLVSDSCVQATLFDDLGEFCLSPSRVALELGGHRHLVDLPGLLPALSSLRSRGCQISLDDLDEGFTDLRLWEEVRPEFVKIDGRLIHRLADNRLRQHLVRALREVAESCSARVIVKGIERPEDFRVVRDLGLNFGQGFFVGHPQSHPTTDLTPAVRAELECGFAALAPPHAPAGKPTSAASILRWVNPVTADADNETVAARFEQDGELDALPVVRNGAPIGLIHRNRFSDAFSRPFRHEIYDHRSCTLFMDADPLIVDQQVTVQELGLILARAERRHLHDGFIIAANGQYAGLGNGHDLMGLLTEMQISAARYANPLTQLPGNVPINYQIDHLLASGRDFVVCHADLDNFKPFNDAYGYRMGDDVILALTQVILEAVDPRFDFVGHIGGDDFVILLQSPDWLPRCERILQHFDASMLRFFRPEEIEQGGFYGENRRGETVFHALTSVSLGIVAVEAGSYESHRALAPIAAQAKKLAKKEKGSSLFIERRRPDSE